ncbi:anti-sigma factor [Acidimicrobiales bacterium]|nr:anti-sigma factor [Acidimicrobiales bacterium]
MNIPSRDMADFSDDDIVEIARSVESHDFDRIAPPPQVWNNILADLEVEVATQEASARRHTRSRFSSTRILSIAAATLLMVGVAVAIVNTRAGDTAVTEVANAMMTDDGLPVSTSATADAYVRCEDEQCFVQVDLSALPESGADDLELWVINSDVSDMHSLGNVTSSDGRFDLPAGVNATDFPIVDISIEPDDGDETHSGQSVLRGVFAQP